MKKPARASLALLGLLLSASLGAAAAQSTAIPKTLDTGEALGVLAARCASCHDWAGSYDAVMASGLFIAGKPDESPAWVAISEGRMPADGPLAEADKAAVLAWIQAGAPRPSAGAAASSEAATPSPPPSAAFLGFKDKEAFHRFSGWASGGLLMAAGVLGAVHAYDMFSTAHAWRDANYPNMGNFDPANCPAEVDAVWGNPGAQALRWTHVGLLAAGESFYLANALTGTSFMGKLGPGWPKSRIHRYAFFVHASLMVAEGVMGYFTSDALRRGDHDTFHSLIVAHAGVGIAIPVVILGAGAIMDPKVRL